MSDQPWWKHLCPECGFTSHTETREYCCPNDGTTLLVTEATVDADERLAQQMNAVRKHREQPSTEGKQTKVALMLTWSMPTMNDDDLQRIIGETLPQFNYEGRKLNAEVYVAIDDFAEGMRTRAQIQLGNDGSSSSGEKNWFPRQTEPLDTEPVETLTEQCPEWMLGTQCRKPRLHEGDHLFHLDDEKEMCKDRYVVGQDTHECVGLKGHNGEHQSAPMMRRSGSDRSMKWLGARLRCQSRSPFNVNIVCDRGFHHHGPHQNTAESKSWT